MDLQQSHEGCTASLFSVESRMNSERETNPNEGIRKLVWGVWKGATDFNASSLFLFLRLSPTVQMDPCANSDLALQVL